MEIQTYIHAFIIRKLHIYYILFLSHLRSCVLKLMSVLHEVICVGIEFQRDAPAKEKLVLNRSILALGSIIDRDGARLLWLTLIRCPFHPRFTAVARKRPRSFCQKCRWQVTPKHAYTFDPTKSEWADYTAVQA